jgi:hypothetical protein
VFQVILYMFRHLFCIFRRGIFRFWVGIGASRLGTCAFLFSADTFQNRITAAYIKVTHGRDDPPGRPLTSRTTGPRIYGRPGGPAPPSLNRHIFAFGADRGPQHQKNFRSTTNLLIGPIFVPIPETQTNRFGLSARMARPGWSRQLNT